MPQAELLQFPEFRQNHLLQLPPDSTAMHAQLYPQTYPPDVATNKLLRQAGESAHEEEAAWHRDTARMDFLGSAALCCRN